MTFEDLPPRASQIPLTNRRVAGDVIDLIIGDADRAAGCVAVMVCDSEDRGIQPILLHDVPVGAAIGDFEQLLEMLLPLVSARGGSVLIGRGRPRGTAPDDTERTWHQMAIDSCAAHGVGLLGYLLATADGIFRLPDPLSAAS